MAIDKRVAYALLGTAAAGAGLGLVYYYYTKKNQETGDLVELETEIEETHLQWLDGIAAKHTSGDSVMALHTLIAHCQSVSKDKEGGEKIFKEIRCNTCGDKNKVPFTAKLTQEQLTFIDTMTSSYDITAGRDKVLRIMFEYVINDAEETVVFGA